MMKRTLKLIAVATGLLFIAGAAQSATTISLIWRVNGTKRLDPSTETDTTPYAFAFFGTRTNYIMDVVLSNTDAPLVNGVFISLFFDTDAGNELNFVRGEADFFYSPRRGTYGQSFFPKVLIYHSACRRRT